MNIWFKIEDLFRMTKTLQKKKCDVMSKFSLLQLHLIAISFQII